MRTLPVARPVECRRPVQCSLCDVQQACAADRAQHAGWLAAHRLAAIRRRVLVLSGKGGVGKSTVAVNLAVALAQRGLRTAVADADLAGPNVPQLLGLTDTRVRLGPDGLVPVTAAGVTVFSLGFMMGAADPLLVRDSMKHELLSQLLAGVAWGELDLLLVDMPPGTGGELIALAELDPQLYGCVLVSTPHRLARADARRAVSALAETGVPLLGTIENMTGFICGCCGAETPLTGCTAAVEPFPGGSHAPVLARVPLDPAAAAAAEAGEPVVRAAPASPAARALLRAADALHARLEL
jgi:Mrp family chromosome partitioning ATPase